MMIWAGISLGCHTELHVCHEGTMTVVRYRDQFLTPYDKLYAGAIGGEFLIMDDNGRLNRARLVDEYLEHQGFERMGWPAESSIRTLIRWD